MTDFIIKDNEFGGMYWCVLPEWLFTEKMTRSKEEAMVFNVEEHDWLLSICGSDTALEAIVMDDVGRTVTGE